MNIQYIKNPFLREGNIVVHYKQSLYEVKKTLYHTIGSQIYLQGYDERKRCMMISLGDIQFAENVDSRCFLYTSKHEYQSVLSFKQLCTVLKNFDFIQINRITIVNVRKIETIEVIGDCKRRITLKDGESMIVNRSFRRYIDTYFKK